MNAENTLNDSQRARSRPAARGSADGVVLTQHALERYMERSGSKRVFKSLNKIESMAARAVRIDSKRVYANGWIMKVVSGEIVTMYKPKHPSQLRKIYKAMNPPNAKLTDPLKGNDEHT